MAILGTGVLQMGVIYLPFFNSIFKTQPLSFKELTLTLGVSSIVFFAVEIEKATKRHLAKVKLRTV